MKTVLAICLALAVLSVEAQWRPSLPSLGGPSLADMARITSAITSFHSTLSRTPLRPFLPSSAQMVSGIMGAVSQARNMQEAIQKAGEAVNTMIVQAAEQARLPLPQLNQLQTQMQNSLSQAVNQVGSAPPASVAQEQ